ncbi:MAG: DUF309 domain-containing protein [Planctomycetaceae bacterium]
MTSGPSPVWPDAPRHAPGRPFPPCAFLPGKNAHPRRDPAGQAPRPPDRAETREEIAYGVDLYHAGYFWEAHEAWEGPWTRARSRGNRGTLQGLILLSAALLKLSLGEERGARRLLDRSLRRLEEACAIRRGSLGLDLEEILEGVRALAERPSLERAPRIRL